jgi:hypothetical protein
MKEDDRLYILFCATIPLLLRASGLAMEACYVETLMSRRDAEKDRNDKKVALGFAIR